MAEPVVATFSIVARDLERDQLGVATQSKFLAVGSVVPWAEVGAGAVATQAYANPSYGPEGLRLLRDGLSANEVVERLTSADEGRDHRQLGVVDARGRSATFTGPSCMSWAGGIAGPGFAAQGNILVGVETVEALAETFTANAELPLPQRLIACLAAAQAAGGDKRGQQSAALLVVEPDAGYAGLSDVLVDLRVDDHPQPIDELARLHELHARLFGKTPDRDWLTIDDDLRSELAEHLARLGYTGEFADALASWAGTENLEERLSGADRIDPVVLAELRAR